MRVDIQRFNELIDLVDGITRLDEESDDYSFIYRSMGSLLDHIRTQMRNEYRIYKDITGGMYANFNQFEHRSTNMSQRRQDLEPQGNTPVKDKYKNQNPKAVKTNLNSVVKQPGMASQNNVGSQGNSQNQLKTTTQPTWKSRE